MNEATYPTTNLSITLAHILHNIKQMTTFSDLLQSVFVRNKTCFFELVARLAQSVEHETLNLRVVGSNPSMGACIYRLVTIYRSNCIVIFLIITQLDTLFKKLEIYKIF